MPKIIEQLELNDLKLAFKNYLEMELTPKEQIPKEWRKFWLRVVPKCSVVERI